MVAIFPMHTNEDLLQDDVVPTPALNCNRQHFDYDEKKTGMLDHSVLFRVEML